MNIRLSYYTLFPKVFPAHRTGRVSIRPRGAHAAFEEGTCYQVVVIPMNETILNDQDHPYPSYDLLPEGGSLCFDHPFGNEGQYTILVQPTDREKSPLPRRTALPASRSLQQFRVYAVEEDLFALRPFKGDFHTHSCRSDGKESPAVVAADYRKAGFDFLAITDHERYEPSLEAIAAYREAAIDLKLFPGEEVHPPDNNTHYINFGGEYSLNHIFRQEEDRYRREVGEIAASLDMPGGLNRQEYASLLWICREIRKAKGLSVMVHPHWVDHYAYHVREDLCIYELKQKPFDAFELVNGMPKFDNQMQIALWQQLRSEGFQVPIVGGSDSHSTEQPVTWFQVAQTLVFAEACEKEPLLEAVRNRRAVVVEQYPGEPAGVSQGETQPNFYGEYRYVAFSLFLWEEYFPLHDELCFEEGRLMKEFAGGDAKAGRLLEEIQGRCGDLMKKCWGS